MGRYYTGLTEEEKDKLVSLQKRNDELADDLDRLEDTLDDAYDVFVERFDDGVDETTEKIRKYYQKYEENLADECKKIINQINSIPDFEKSIEEKFSNIIKKVKSL